MLDDKPKNDKLKNDAPRINNVLFVLLWVAGHVASWVLAMLVNQLLISQRIYISSQFMLGMLMALGTGIPTAIVQTLLVERGLKKSMRGWLPVSVIGWTLSGLAFYALWIGIQTIPYPALREYYYLLPRLMFLPLFVPVAVVQWFWLRRKVKSAGLWALAALAGALMFAVPASWTPGGSNYYDYVFMQLFIGAAAALLYSGATGTTMLYLWSQQREKAKKAALESQQDEADTEVRAERLQDKPEDDSAAPARTYRTPEVLKANRS